MSSLITDEIHFLLESILLGMLLSAGYEGIRLFRSVIPHGPVGAGLGDIFFWIVTAFILFSMILNENDGRIRWYALAGCAAGACVFRFYIHPVILWILRPLWKPVQIVGRFVEKPLKKFVNFVTLKGRKTIQKYSSRQRARKEARHDRIRQKKEEKKKSAGDAGHHRRGAGAGGSAGISDHAAEQKEQGL